ncbi:MAG: hypothetical protein AAGJ81_13160 [Verrucomicrobiota bacterium]
MKSVEINPRVNLYIFAPHPEWEGVIGTVAVSARDFQRAERIALKEAEKQGVPGRSFSILLETETDQSNEGYWTEIERYRDVEDTERLVLFHFGQVITAENLTESKG